jgi:transcriptional regulator with XRE-family HTH domain
MNPAWRGRKAGSSPGTPSASLRAGAMDPKARRAELKAFLRARRALLSPESVGLPRGPRRLTPGLRREEVASIAGVGVTWYTWLEQGREINVSDDTLWRVSRALKLSPSDKAYLFTLVGLPMRQKHETLVSEAMRLAVAGFTAGPAMVFGPRFDVLVYNQLADLVYSMAMAGDTGPFGNNHLWRLFMDPERRRLYGPDYLEPGGRNLVGVFRVRYAEHIGEPEFDDFVHALSAGSALFAKLWKERATQPLLTIQVPLNHPRLGPLKFHSVRTTPGDGSANSIYFLPPADAATISAMRRAMDPLGDDHLRGPRRSSGSGTRR